MSTMSSFAILTSDSLKAALLALAEAKTEQDIGMSFVAAATLMQDAVKAGQTGESFSNALASIDDPRLAEYLLLVLSRAVNFHYQEDGGVLGFWLLAVTLDKSQFTDASLALKMDSMQLLRASADLSKQMGLSVADGGWVCVLPKLISATALQNTELGDIIRLPQQARRWVQGQVKEVSFNVDNEVEAEHGLYYLPMVVRHPASQGINSPSSDEKVMFRVTKWVKESLPEAADITVLGAPEPFSMALESGERFFRSKYFEDFVGETEARFGVSPRGLVCLLASYHTEDDEEFLGLSLVSKLTGDVLNTTAVPLKSAVTHLNECKAVLQSLGVSCVMAPESLDSKACQHCGELQYAIPRITHATGPGAGSTQSLH